VRSALGGGTHRAYDEAQLAMRPNRMTHEQERRARRSLLERWQATRDRCVAALRDEGDQATLRAANPDALAAEQTTSHMLGVLEHNDARELVSIVHALRRLRAGVYGRCIVCGSAIGPSQLETAPEAATCPACTIERD
jgi:RNA polymerase-binding transcription factor DksA